MMARVQDGAWVYRVLMVEVAEVIWLMDPFLPFLFTWTYRPPNLLTKFTYHAFWLDFARK
jgi:hypothetical protein